MDYHSKQFSAFDFGEAPAAAIRAQCGMLSGTESVNTTCSTSILRYPNRFHFSYAAGLRAFYALRYIASAFNQRILS